MPNVLVSRDSLENTANAIRIRNDDNTVTYKPSEFADAILNIRTRWTDTQLKGGISAPTSTEGADGDIYLQYSETYTHLLPEEYIPAAYLEVKETGGPYILPGLDASDITAYEIKHQYINTPRLNTFFFGCWKGFTVIGNLNGKILWYIGTRINGTSDAIPIDYNPHVYKATKNNLLLDNVSVGTPVWWTITSDSPIGIFKDPDYDAINYSRIYYCKIWNNENLIRDMAPCVRIADNKPGMYDLINDVFYTNAGTDEFEYCISDIIVNMFVKIDGSWEEGILNRDKDNINLGNNNSVYNLSSKNIVANGIYDARNDSFDGYNTVIVNVPNTYGVGDEGKVISSGILINQEPRSLEIIENGIYDTTENNLITVNVPEGSGSSQTELGVFTGMGQPQNTLGNNNDIYFEYMEMPTGVIGNSGCYFNTGIRFYPKYTIEVVFSIASSTGGGTIFGSQYRYSGGPARDRFALILGNYLTAYYSHTTSNPPEIYQTNYTKSDFFVPHKVTLSQGELYIDDTLIYTFKSPGTNTYTPQLAIFTENNNVQNGGFDTPVGSASGIILYSMKIYNDSNVLIKDFIPFIDENEDVCFKDTVSNGLIKNLGDSHTLNMTSDNRRQFVRQWTKNDDAWAVTFS